ncbi:hypothetical protein [Shinella sp.]|uniref:hypothetical protein n=1 Tax=Shinella sp. TaxID=1870904 RepID=UPI00301BFD81
MFSALLRHRDRAEKRDPLMQGKSVGKSIFYRRHSDKIADVRGADDAQPAGLGEERDCGLSVLAMSAAAFSGAIAGFLLSGSLALAGATFGAALAGMVLGWWARGVSI